MQTRLLVSILVLVLSGADSGAALMCAAYCMSSVSVGTSVVHRRQMDPQASSAANASHDSHTRQHEANCADCPPKSGSRLNLKTDCDSFIQVQTLQEGSLCQDTPSRNTQVDVTGPPTDALNLAGDGGGHLVLFEISETSRSSDTPPIPLRI
jgi:hypothetical protein